MLLHAPAQQGAGTMVTALGEGLEGNTAYRFRVWAYSQAEDGEAQGSSPTPETGAVTLSAPDELTVEALSPSSVRLTWRDRSEGEIAFKLERKAGAGSWLALGTAAASPATGELVETTRSGLARGTRYSFRVRAYNPGGHSSYSEPVTLTLPR